MQDIAAEYSNNKKLGVFQKKWQFHLARGIENVVHVMDTRVLKRHSY